MAKKQVRGEHGSSKITMNRKNGGKERWMHAVDMHRHNKRL